MSSSGKIAVSIFIVLLVFSSISFASALSFSDIGSWFAGFFSGGGTGKVVGSGDGSGSESTNGLIKFYVLDSVSGSAISGASVKLSNSGGSYTATLDGSMYTFSSIPTGTYTATISASGYASASQTAYVNSGSNNGVVVYLTKATTTTSAPSVSLTSDRSAYPTGGTAVLTATVSDPSNVGVQAAPTFYWGTIQLTGSSAHPSTNVWTLTMTNLNAGTFDLVSKFTDTTGTVRTSSIITVVVGSVSSTSPTTGTTTGSGSGSTTGSGTTVGSGGGSGTLPTPSSTSYHPADINKDWKITMNEVTEYGATRGNNQYYQTASTIWKSGESYKWDPSVSNWVPTNTGTTSTTSRFLVCGSVGDVNGDGVISQADVDSLSDLVAGIRTPFAVELVRGDVSGDGQLLANDITTLKNFIAGIVSTFPRCGTTTTSIPTCNDPRTLNIDKGQTKVAADAIGTNYKISLIGAQSTTSAEISVDGILKVVTLGGSYTFRKADTNTHITLYVNDIFYATKVGTLSNIQLVVLEGASSSDTTCDLQFSINEGQTMKRYDVVGYGYDLTIKGISSSTSATMGYVGNSMSITKGGTLVLPYGSVSNTNLRLYVKDIFYATKTGTLGSVEFYQLRDLIGGSSTPVPATTATTTTTSSKKLNSANLCAGKDYYQSTGKDTNGATVVRNDRFGEDYVIIRYGDDAVNVQSVDGGLGLRADFTSALAPNKGGNFVYAVDGDKILDSRANPILQGYIYPLQVREGENISNHGFVVVDAGDNGRILQLVLIGAGTSVSDVTIFQDVLTGEQFRFATGVFNGTSSNIDGQTYYVAVSNDQRKGGNNYLVNITWGMGVAPGNVGFEKTIAPKVKLKSGNWIAFGTLGDLREAYGLDLSNFRVGADLQLSDPALLFIEKNGDMILVPTQVVGSNTRYLVPGKPMMTGGVQGCSGGGGGGETNISSYRNAHWTCYDKTDSGLQGGATSCKSQDVWQNYAEDFCKNRCDGTPRCAPGCTFSNNKCIPTDTSAGYTCDERAVDSTTGRFLKCGVNTFGVDEVCGGKEPTSVCTSEDKFTLLADQDNFINYRGKKYTLSFVERKMNDGLYIDLMVRSPTQTHFPALKNLGERVILPGEGISVYFAEWVVTASGKFNAVVVLADCTPPSSGGGGNGGSPISTPTTPKPATVSCDNGCLNSANKCLPYGTRQSGLFCSLDGFMIDQKAALDVCENSYECSSNACIESKCIEMSVWQKFLSWFFGSGNQKAELFPKSVSGYTLDSSSVEEEKEECGKAEDATDVAGTGLKGEYCLKTTHATYESKQDSTMLVEIGLIQVTKGLDVIEAIVGQLSQESVSGKGGVEFFNIEKSELVWFTKDKTYQLVFTQENSGDATANPDNGVVQAFKKRFGTDYDVMKKVDGMSKGGGGGGGGDVTILEGGTKTVAVNGKKHDLSLKVTLSINDATIIVDGIQKSVSRNGEYLIGDVKIVVKDISHSAVSGRPSGIELVVSASGGASTNPSTGGGGGGDQRAICGNGVKDGGEECDFGSANGACPGACSVACKVNSCSGSSAVPALTLNEGSSMPVGINQKDHTIGLKIVSSIDDAVILVDNVLYDVKKGTSITIGDMKIYTSDLSYATKIGTLGSITFSVSAAVPPNATPQPNSPADVLRAAPVGSGG